MRTVAIAALLPLAACGALASDGAGEGIAPSGSGTTRNYPVSDFTKIALKGADDVVVSVGPAFAVRAEGPSDALDKLRITRDGATLSVDRKRGIGIGWGSSGEGVKVYVSMPAIAAASLAGSGDLSVDRVTGGEFAASVAGSGDLSVGDLKVSSTALSIAGSGGIAAKGATQTLDMSIAGSGDISAAGLTAAGATVAIAGSGNATATVDGSAKVSLVGSGDAILGPRARCKVSRIGSGEARCG